MKQMLFSRNWEAKLKHSTSWQSPTTQDLSSFSQMWFQEVHVSLPLSLLSTGKTTLRECSSLWFTQNVRPTKYFKMVCFVAGPMRRLKCTGTWNCEPLSFKISSWDSYPESKCMIKLMEFGIYPVIRYCCSKRVCSNEFLFKFDVITGDN